MLDHVHAVVWSPMADQIRRFMKPWKRRGSIPFKRLIREALVR